MHQLGLVSISFRRLSPERIIALTRDAGLQCIEWGSDVHAPKDDPDRLLTIARMQKAAGLYCCSYGTYFRLGSDDVQELPSYIAAAAALGTNVLRLWCGSRNYEQMSPEEWTHLTAECAKAAVIAEKAGAVLCMECHNNTATNCLAGAKALMEAVDSPAFRMYWQPNQYRTREENLAYAAAMAALTEHVHVFNWDCPDGKNLKKHPLAEAVDTWKAYMTQLAGEHTMLLEFMPDDRLESLAAEAEALRRIAL